MYLFGLILSSVGLAVSAYFGNPRGAFRSELPRNPRLVPVGLAMILIGLVFQLWGHYYA